MSTVVVAEAEDVAAERPAPVAGALHTAVLLLILLGRPHYLASPYSLGVVIAAQVVFAALSRYRKSFFLILMAAFLWAGADLPLVSMGTAGRC